MDKDSGSGGETVVPSARAQSARSKQIDELARKYRGALLRFFTKQVGDPADAEDLAQEVFVRMIRNEKMTDVQHMESYLFQTAWNLLRDRARRNETHRVYEHIPFDESRHEGHAPSEERVYEGREAVERFLNVVEEMPPRRRTVFLLHRFTGLSYGAIALELGISVGVVEKHMTKALLQLHTRLGL